MNYTYKHSNGTASSPSSRSLGPVRASIVAFALVGTGGLSSSSYMHLAKRQEHGYRIFAYENPAQELSIAGRTTIEDLERIRAILKPPVTDLAALFNVSRQTIYDWQAGQPTSQRNTDVLAEMAKAADLFSREGVDAPANLLKRKARGGRTYAEEIAAGAPSYELLASSVKMLKRETEQRKVLAAQFAGRKVNRDRISEFLTPTLDEQG